MSAAEQIDSLHPRWVVVSDQALDPGRVLQLRCEMCGDETTVSWYRRRYATCVCGGCELNVPFERDQYAQVVAELVRAGRFADQQFIADLYGVRRQAIDSIEQGALRKLRSSPEAAEALRFLMVKRTGQARRGQWFEVSWFGEGWE